MQKKELDLQLPEGFSLVLELGSTETEPQRVSYRTTKEEWEALGASLNQVVGMAFRYWNRRNGIDKEHLLFCLAFANEIGRMCQELSPVEMEEL